MDGWRRAARWAASTALVLAGALVVPSPAAAEEPELVDYPARQADSVVESYGVGIHLPFLDTPYANVAKVADALADLGVRHVRDDLFLDRPDQYAGIETVADRGIGFDLIMGRPDRPGTPADYVDIVADLPAGAVESVEGVNEWDLFGSGRPAWAAEVAAWQQELYEEVKATPETAHLPVLSPSLAFRWNYAHLPDLSPWSDIANAHMYPGGYKPGTEVANITDALRTVVPSKPLMTTETGYHNAINTTNGHHPVTEEVAGIYYPRLLLEHVARGHARVYSYELIDEFADAGKTNPEANFGLLRRDWSPKPAYTAMKRLLALLSDRGPSFTPTDLRLGVSGWPSDGRYMVTQKRDGTHVLLLWRDASVWNPLTRAAVSVAPADVTLSLDGPHRIAVQQVSGGAASTSTGLVGDGAGRPGGGGGVAAAVGAAGGADPHDGSVALVAARRRMGGAGVGGLERGHALPGVVGRPLPAGRAGRTTRGGSRCARASGSRSRSARATPPAGAPPSPRSSAAAEALGGRVASRRLLTQERLESAANGPCVEVGPCAAFYAEQRGAAGSTSRTSRCPTHAMRSERRRDHFGRGQQVSTSSTSERSSVVEQRCGASVVETTPAGGAAGLDKLEQARSTSEASPYSKGVSRRRSMMWPVSRETRTLSDARPTCEASSSVPGGSSPNALSRIGVAVRSGLMQLTRTPAGPHSSASAWVRLTTAAFAEEYRL